MENIIDVTAHSPPVSPALLAPPVYRLTWPADQRGVATVAGQWQRNEAGEIEAWYTAAQLAAALEAMVDVQTPRGPAWAAREGEVEYKSTIYNPASF